MRSVITPGETYHSRSGGYGPPDSRSLPASSRVGRLLGRLALVDRAGRDFEQRLADRVPLVLDQADVPVVDHRHQRDGPAVDDDFSLERACRRERHRLERQVDLQSPVDQDGEKAGFMLGRGR